MIGAAVVVSSIAVLAAHGGSLIAVQNGPPPHRVVRLDLSAGGDSVCHVEVLLRAHPAFDEPTLGTVADGWFYLVANSQWGRFRDGACRRRRRWPGR